MTGVIDRACHSQHDVVWLGGDMNLLIVDWKTNSTTGNQYSKVMNQAYINKLQDAGLLQVNHNPTRGDAIFDILLTNRPSLLSRCGVIPGLSDHGILLCDSIIQPARIKPVSRTVHDWAKADTYAMKQYIYDLH